MATKLAALLALVHIIFVCSAAQGNFVNFWYTCDFHMEPDPDDMSDECRKIYSNKVGEAEVYELYKTEAELFFRFRNKLVECESNGRTCTFSDNNSAFTMPLLIGYDINNRMRLYKESAMNQCYLEPTNNIEFIKCIIETRKKLLAAIKQVCSGF